MEVRKGYSSPLEVSNTEETTMNNAVKKLALVSTNEPEVKDTDLNPVHDTSQGIARPLSTPHRPKGSYTFLALLQL